MTQHVSQDVVDILRDQLDPSEVPVAFDVDDDIGFDAYGDVEQDVYVVPVSEDPTVPGGGETSYTGIDAGGDGGVQDRVWAVLVDCWGGDYDADVYDDGSSHPRLVANALGHAVQDVFFELEDANTPDPYEWVNAEPPVTANDPNRDPTKYRKQVTVLLKDTKTPE